MSLFINKATIEYIYRGRRGEVIPDDVTVVTIHRSVKRIPNNAFREHERLEIVKLHKEVTSIGERAFCECVNLREINLHESSIEVIHVQVFGNCKSLMAVYFPKLLQGIGKLAFWNCHSLISAELPPAVEVHDWAFVHCFTLELRQSQVNYNSLIREQVFQRSRESIRYPY